MSLRAIYYSVQDVGKHVKKSKRRFIWKFLTKGQEHVVEMYVSYLSGKKDILLDSRSIYQAQKVTSSFQFPFQVEGNQCMLVQHGDQYELRINNQVFSHLYNQEKMKKEFEYVDETSVKNKGYQDDFGSRDSGFGRRDDSDDEMPTQSYKPKAEASYQSKTQLSSKPKKEFGDDNGDNGFGFAEAFDKFDYKSTKSSAQQDPFDSYSNKYSENQKASKPIQSSGFGEINMKKDQKAPSFDQFETQPKQFSGFDQFSQFDQKPNVSQSGFEGFEQKPKQAPPTTTAADLLDLDFGGSTQAQPTNPAPTQNIGFDAFSTQPTQPISQTPAQQFGGFATQAPMNTSQGTSNQNKNNLNDLMGLEFGGLNLGSTEASTNVATSTYSSNMNQGQAPKLTNFLDNQFQSQAQPQPQPQAQAQTQQKKDLWSSELVNLDSNEVLNSNKNTGNQNYDYGTYNTNMGYSNQNNYGGYNNAGYGGMNTNSSMGGYGANQGYNTSQGFATNQGGYGGNQAYYGNQGGFATNANTQQQNYSNVGGYGVDNTQHFGGSNAVSNDVKTPFDF